MGYCPSCGTELAPDVSYCPSCGREIADPGEGETAGGQAGTAESTSEPTAQGGESAAGDGTDASQPATNTDDTGSSQSATKTDANRSAQAASGATGGATAAQGTNANAAGDDGGMSRRTLIAGGVGGAAVAIGGVAVLGGGLPGSSPPLDELEVRLVDVRYPDVGVTTATLPLIIAIENPTDQEIEGLTGDLDVMINDRRVASDDISITELDPGEQRHVDLEILIEYAESGQAIREAIGSGSFELTVVAVLEAGDAERRVERSTSL